MMILEEMMIKPCISLDIKLFKNTYGLFEIGWFEGNCWKLFSIALFQNDFNSAFTIIAVEFLKFSFSINIWKNIDRYKEGA